MSRPDARATGATSGCSALADPRADHDQHDRDQAERRQGRRAGPTDRRRSPCRSRWATSAATPNVATRADEGAAGRDAGVRGARRRGSSTSASSTNARRSCSRCSSTPAPVRTCSATCRRSRARFPGCSFAAVAIKGERAAAARADPLARADVPGRASTATASLAALYKVASCPQVTFAYPGGVVQSPALLEPPIAARRCARGSAELVAAAGGAQAGRGAGADERRAGAAGVGWRAPRGRGGAARLRSARARRRRSRGAGSLTRALAARRRAATARAVQPLSRRARGGRAPRAGAGGLPRVLPPHRPRPRRRAHADRGGGARADAARRLPHRRAARRTCC